MVAYPENYANPPATAFPIAAPAKPKVLIVDDNPSNLQLLMHSLCDDYAIIAATTGDKALTLAQKEPVPDLIILDIILPDLDGYTVCSYLKQNPLTQSIPVIFVTALGKEGDEARGFELGAVDYIVKPYRVPIVQARIQSHLALQCLNQELNRKNQELVRATQLKDEFLAKMSHELRTPLNAILGITEALQEETFGEINPRQSKALQTIERSGVHLLDLINDILDVAKIESGQISLECLPTEVSALCKSSLLFVTQQAQKKNIQLSLHLPSYLPDIWVDERRMRQVLINLLTNAVKFTPESGQVSLTARVIIPDPRSVGPDPDLPPLQSHDPWLEISVTDTGIGIAPENLGILFQPFVQVDNSLSRRNTGTGLGLVLAKQITESHGGRITVMSEVGMGSCFRILLPTLVEGNSAIGPTLASSPAAPVTGSSLLPVRVSPAAATQSPNWATGSSIAPQSAPLVLLAEDNAANILTMGSFLEAKGYQLLVAHDGAEAVQLFQQHNPAIVIMDIQMPGMDGLEAMQRIRSQPQGQTVPIIAVTALVMARDRERCLEAGATDYLSKPVRLRHLVALIQSHLAAQRRE